EMGLMMLPMVFIIITGNIDLSVASTLAMCASLLGYLHIQGVNIWIAALAALLLGVLGGALNGYLIARVKLPALVVTLGTYAFYRGIAYGLLGDQAATGYPPAFTFLGQGTLGAIRFPLSAVLFIVCAIIFGLVLHKFTFGRYLYAIGNSEEAVRYSGVSVARVKMIIFILSGFMSALAGVVIAARFGSTRPDVGTGLELSVITATVLGGINIFGGSGTMIGAILALLLIGLMRFGMGLVNVQGQVQSIAIGLLLIFSILLPNAARQLSRRGLQIQRGTAVSALVMLALGGFFIWFFFWSRIPVLNQ
ncbi:MAG: ABC transporter permease, partial [Anaerolineales bacterium]|nr:ABC transporter permease [Anaerolineales bacterium]